MSRSVAAARLVRQQQTCSYCRVNVPVSERTVDHEPPKSLARSLGDQPTYRLLMACRDCNELKGARTEGQFRSWLETPSGERWLRVRREEAATGRRSLERLDVDGARGRQSMKRNLRADQATRRRKFRDMRLHGWSDDEIRKKWSTDG